MKDIKLSEIVESNYCRCDLHSACVKGENNDSLTCAKCTADTLEKSPDLDINRRKYGRYRPSLLISFFRELTLIDARSNVRTRVQRHNPLKG
jgi:hypothetical protein